MKTSEGYRFEMYAKKPSTKVFFRDMPEMKEYFRNPVGNKVFHTKGFAWHFDIIVKGIGNRIEEPDLALMEEMEELREMAEEMEMAMEMMSYDYEPLTTDTITKELAEIWLGKEVR